MKAAVGGILLGLIPAGLLAAAERPPLEHAMMGVANGCFVETVAFLDRWKETSGSDAWARLLQWGAKEDEEVVMGHAVAVCEARGALWSWDINHGWSRLPVDVAQREDAGVVAGPVLAKYPRITARFPTYRFDFPQAASASLPVAQPANNNPSLRDATMVGARLARHRPVNVVTFKWSGNGQEKESAAVVFLFHGRYCIYAPEIGTIPFRVRGGTENLRLIQQLLRRWFPGLGEVRKLAPG
jgi:hypothetical protein